MKTIANLCGSPLQEAANGGAGYSLLVTDDPTNTSNNREIKYLKPTNMSIGSENCKISFRENAVIKRITIDAPQVYLGSAESATPTIVNGNLVIKNTGGDGQQGNLEVEGTIHGWSLYDNMAIAFNLDNNLVPNNELNIEDLTSKSWSDTSYDNLTSDWAEGGSTSTKKFYSVSFNNNQNINLCFRRYNSITCYTGSTSVPVFTQIIGWSSVVTYNNTQYKVYAALNSYYQNDLSNTFEYTDTSSRTYYYYVLLSNLIFARLTDVYETTEYSPSSEIWQSILGTTFHNPDLIFTWPKNRELYATGWGMDSTKIRIFKTTYQEKKWSAI